VAASGESWPASRDSRDKRPTIITVPVIRFTRGFIFPPSLFYYVGFAAFILYLWRAINQKSLASAVTTALTKKLLVRNISALGVPGSLKLTFIIK